jgi:uncharacterized protein (DUF2164 family)
MSNIKFSTPEKEQLTLKIQNYFERELDQEIGQFDAEFLLDFFSKEVGYFYYNRGVFDAKNIIAARLADISESMDEALAEIEKSA